MRSSRIGRWPGLGLASIILPVGAAGQAQPGLSLRISDEITPPGGVAQVHVLLTEPKPITIGAMRMRAFTSSTFGSLRGVSMLGPQGDVSATATQSGDALQVAFVSPSGSFGMLREYPILAVKFEVRPDVPLGLRVRMGLDLSESYWEDLAGQLYPAEFKPGWFLAADRVSVSNVTPGGGPVAAGSTISVTGSGFEAGAEIRIENVELSPAIFLGPTLLKATLINDARMDGKRVRVRNPDGSEDTYYSFLRFTGLGRSARPLLAATEPVFALRGYSDAIVSPATTGVFDGASYVTGIAIQNPASAPVAVTLQVFTPANQQAGQTSFTLPARTRILREIREFLPSVEAQQGGYVRVFSSAPVQVLGVAGEENTGAVAPLVPAAP